MLESQTWDQDIEDAGFNNGLQMITITERESYIML